MISSLSVSLHRRTSSGVVAMVLLASTIALGQVHDNAHLFSGGAIQTATQNIQKMQSSFGHTMLVETFPSVPAEQRDALERDRNGFFQQWAVDRAKSEGISGVMLLICMEPKHYEIVVGNKTQQSGTFTDADRTAVGSQIRSALSAGRYDEVLTQGTAAVLDRVTANRANARSGSSNTGTSNGPSYGNTSDNRSTQPPPAAAPSVGMGSWLCLGIAALGIFMIVRRLFSGGRGAGPGFGGGAPGAGMYPQGGPRYGQNPGYGGSGGGGFGRGMLGGLLGGVAGGWLGNRVFGQGQHQAPPSSSGGVFGGGPEAPSNPNFTAPDTDFSGGGGDFGSGGGGVDTSGGGGGGGDSGGGDF